MLDADGFPKLYPKCKCQSVVFANSKQVPAGPSICTTAFPFSLEFQRRPRLSSSSATKAYKTIKLGRNIDPDAILAQLSREWKDMLFKFANN